ncbi:hypothetical protein PO124_12110 [Bacillus licheniformis]|nr:hypothetical protein [Bacillus licheniformis]
MRKRSKSRLKHEHAESDIADSIKQRNILTKNCRQIRLQTKKSKTIMINLPHSKRQRTENTPAFDDVKQQIQDMLKQQKDRKTRTAGRKA